MLESIKGCRQEWTTLGSRMTLRIFVDCLPIQIEIIKRIILVRAKLEPV